MCKCNSILCHAKMTRDIFKLIVSLCVVTAIVGGQSLRGQPSRFGGPSADVVKNPSTPIQMSRQQQMSSRILGSQLWDRENAATAQSDQFPLQSSSRFSMSPRTARLLAPFASQAQRNMQTFQQRNYQGQQNQILQGLQQQRQQRLRQLQNNRILQSRSRLNMLSRASNRATQRREMNTPVASSRIPLPSQQRRQLQQTLASRDASKLSTEENSLLSSPWNEELPLGNMQSSLGSFPERQRITNPNLQQQIWQQRRINNMLRRQKNEKHREEQLTLQTRQQEEKMHRLMLQEQELKQHWHTQQPELPNTIDGFTVVSLKSHESTSQPADMSTTQTVTSSVKALDQVDVKQERIHRLAGLLGFKPSELAKAVAELETNKVSFGTPAGTDLKANMLVNMIMPDVVSTTTSLVIDQELLSNFNSGVQNVVGDNVVKTQPFSQDVPPLLSQTVIPSHSPLLLVTTEITGRSTTSAPAIIITSRSTTSAPAITITSRSTTSAPAITIIESASTTDSSSTLAEALPVAVHGHGHSVTASPPVSGASNITTGASAEPHKAGTQISDSHSTIDVQHLLYALLGPMASVNLLNNDAISNETKTLLMQIQNLIANSNKTVHMDSNTAVYINGNSSNNVAIPHDNSGQFVNTYMTAEPVTRDINNMLNNGTTVAPVTVTAMGPDAWNMTGDTTVEWNVTMTSPDSTTMEMNTTTTVVTEATEAVPTAPPPPPGFPHMFEPLPGQELTEAQLEYNEMRESLMAK